MPSDQGGRKASFSSSAPESNGFCQASKGANSVASTISSSTAEATCTVRERANARFTGESLWRQPRRGATAGTGLSITSGMFISSYQRRRRRGSTAR
ncbi:hypothetical protein D3C86_1936560 [compost metagenome]